MYDLTNTSSEIREAKPQLAIFGIGAIEQHTKNLPVGTDWITVSELSKRVAREINAFLVPALPFSMSQCHGRMAGTVWLKPETLAEVVKDTALSLYEQDIKKVVILNGHGGNFILEPVVQELNIIYKDLSIILIESELAGITDIHAGITETSLQLYLNEKNVRTDWVDYVPSVGREFLDYAVMELISPQGVWGTQSGGNKELGKKIMDTSVKNCIKKIHEIFNTLEEERSD